MTEKKKLTYNERYKDRYPAKRYKEKQCPICGTKHRGQGTYCSRVCSNRNRKGNVSDKVRENMRRVGAEFALTPAGVAAQKNVRNNRPAEDYAIEIPVINNLDDYSDLIEGFDKAEKW